MKGSCRKLRIIIYLHHDPVGKLRSRFPMKKSSSSSSPSSKVPVGKLRTRCASIWRPRCVNVGLADGRARALCLLDDLNDPLRSLLCVLLNKEERAMPGAIHDDARPLH